jgi:ornithine carbamoyltransferase
MRHLLRLSDWSIADLRSLFAAVDRYRSGDGERFDGAAVLFFPPSSLRTRVSFECGASLMGLQPITFPPETLSKDEDVVDVVG